jgi:hypothetical protein
MPRGAKQGLDPVSRLLMIMTVMQFRQVRVIMGEGEVPVHVSMRFLKDRASIVHVVVMLFVLMAVVMFDFLMPVCMRVAPAEEYRDPGHHQDGGGGILDIPSLA